MDKQLTIYSKFRVFLRKYMRFRPNLSSDDMKLHKSISSDDLSLSSYTLSNYTTKNYSDRDNRYT